jgi:hypothetical protein
MKNEKIILVAYLNICDYPAEEVPSVMKDVSEHFSGQFKKDDNVYTIVVPVYDRETEIECINPKLVSEEEYKKAESACKKLEKVITEFISPKKETNE